jgi:hypothetical protein
VRQAPCPTSVEFGLVKATTRGGGCWQEYEAGSARQTRSGVPIEPGVTFYETDDKFTLNGIPFPDAPSGSKYVLARPSSDARGGQLGINRTITVRLGQVTLLRKSLLWKLPTGRSEGELASFSLPSGRLGGLRIGGSVEILFRKRGSSYSTSIPVRVTLPSDFKPSAGTDGTITGETEISTDESRGVNLDGGKIEVDNAAIGKLAIEKLCFSYLSADVSTRFAACEPPSLNDAPAVQCEPPRRSQERFDGAMAIILPTQGKPKLAAYGGISGGRFRYGGGFVDDAGIPLIQGITLERIGLGLCLRPTVLKADGGLAVAKGLVRGDASVEYVESRRFGFSVEAAASLRVADVPMGNGRIRINSTGAVDFDAQAKMLFAGGLLTVDGKVAGVIIPKGAFVFGRGALGFIPPSNRFRFQVEGSVDACLADVVCARTQGVVSNAGVSACGSIAFISYSGFFRFSDKRLLHGFGCKYGDRARVFFYQPHQTGPGTVGFNLPRGNDQYVAHIKGKDAAPKIKVTSPSGRTFTSTDKEVATDKQTFLIVENPTMNETSVFLGKTATPGAWKVEALPGSELTGVVETQVEDKTPPVVAGTVSRVSRRSARRQVDLRYAIEPGQRLAVDVVGPRYQQTVGAVTSGKRGPRGVPAPGRTAAQSKCATLRFTPTFGYRGARTVQVSVLDEEGGVVDTFKVARYTAPKPPLPTKPPNVRLVRKGKNVIAIWDFSKRGVTRYGAYATLSDGRKLGFTAPANCKAWRIPNVARNVRVRLRVQAGRKDLAFSGRSSRTLRPNQRYSGPKKLARAKVPRTCKLIA